MKAISALIDNERNLIISPSEGFVGEHNAEMIEIDIGPFAQGNYDFFVLNFDNGITGGTFPSNIISTAEDKPAYIDNGVIYCPIIAQHTASGNLKIQLEAHKTVDERVTVRKSTVARITFDESIMGKMNLIGESNPLYERIEDAEDRIATAESRLGSAESRITAVEKRTDSAESRISAAESRADSADEKISDAESRLDSVEGRIASSESKIASAEAKILSAESRIDSAERKIASAESRIVSTESRIASAQDRLKSAESRITDIENANYDEAIKSLGIRVDALEEGEQTMDESVKALSSRVLTIEGYKIPENFEGVNQRIDELKNELESLPSYTEIPVASDNMLGGVKISNSSEFGVSEEGVLELRYGNMNIYSLSVLLALALLSGQGGIETVVGNTTDDISSSVFSWSLSLLGGSIDALAFSSFENGILTWIDENYEEKTIDVEKNCIYILRLVDERIVLESYSGNGLRKLILEGI